MWSSRGNRRGNRPLNPRFQRHSPFFSSALRQPQEQLESHYPLIGIVLKASLLTSSLGSFFILWSCGFSLSGLQVVSPVDTKGHDHFVLPYWKYGMSKLIFVHGGHCSPESGLKFSYLPVRSRPSHKALTFVGAVKATQFSCIAKHWHALQRGQETIEGLPFDAFGAGDHFVCASPTAASCAFVQSWPEGFLCVRPANQVRRKDCDREITTERAEI